MKKILLMILASTVVTGTAVMAQVPTIKRLPSASASPALRDSFTVITAIPANRPTRRLFVGMIEAARGDRAALRTAIENANVQLKVQRICYVFGGYPGAAQCVRASDVIAELQRSKGDTELFKMGLNDLWEGLGGAAGGGDLNTCGGRDTLSVTNLLTGSGASGPTASIGSTGSTKAGGGRSASVQTVRGSAATSKLSACRSTQTSGLAGGMGTRHVPGSPGYRDAVANTQAFLTGIAASCRDGSNSLIAAAPGGGSAATPTMTVGGALGWVAGATTDLAGAMASAAEVASGCTSKAKCALGVFSAAFGAAADANDLVGNNSDTARAIGAVDTALDIVGGAVEVAAAMSATAGAVGAAEMVLPALAVGAAAYTIASPIGEASAALLDPVYVKAADYINGVDDTPAAPASEATPSGGSTAGGGVGRPAEDGRSCAAMAASAAAFNAYCSQAGNDWQSYDCMSYVARLNGCADPGLIQPAPGEDYQCSAPRNDAAAQQEACEQREQLKGLLTRRISGGDTSNPGKCASLGRETADFMQRQRTQLCNRVSFNDGGGICASIRSSQSATRSNTR